MIRKILTSRLFWWQMFIATIVIASGFMAWWFIHLPYFSFQRMEVVQGGGRGLKHVNAKLVGQAVLPKIEGNFFTADLDKLRGDIESVPWVRRANLRREWPDALIAEVEEYEVIGTWGEDGRFLSTKGDVFIVNPAEAEDGMRLYTFNGPQGAAPDVLRKFVAFQSWFAGYQLKPIGISTSDRESWAVKLSNGVTVVLGKDSPEGALRARVEKFKKVYSTLEPAVPGGLDEIDMRYANGLTMRPSLKAPVKAKPVRPSAPASDRALAD